MQIRDTRNGSWYWVNTAVNACKHISAHDKVVYGALCTFAGLSEIRPQYSTIAERAAVSIRTAKDSISTLERAGYISIINHGKKGISNIYELVKASNGCKKCTPRTTEEVHATQGEVRATTGSSARRAPQVDSKLDSKLNKSNEDVAGNEVNEIISLFKEINPSYGQLFKNKTERSATDRLIKQYGKEKLVELLDVLPEIIIQPYAPRITTPYQLETGMGKLKAFIGQQKDIQDKNKKSWTIAG